MPLHPACRKFKAPVLFSPYVKLFLVPVISLHPTGQHGLFLFTMQGTIPSVGIPFLSPPSSSKLALASTAYKKSLANMHEHLFANSPPVSFYPTGKHA